MFFKFKTINKNMNFKKILKFILIFLIMPLFEGLVFAQKMNNTEEQIFRAEAVKVIEEYYQKITPLIPVLNDSIVIKDENDKGILVNKKITQKKAFINQFFDNNDIYIYNDLNPDDDAKRTNRRVLTIDEYLTEVKNIYGDMKKEKLTYTIKSANAKEVLYNAQAPEKFYYVKVEIQREMKGMYIGKHFTQNTKQLDFYIKTMDKPNIKLKEFKIISIDFKSRSTKSPDNMTIEEAQAAGMKFFDAGDYDNAFKYLKHHSANKKFAKNANATFALGYMYFWGRGTQKDDTEMVKWLELSADKDNLYALHYMGENYYYGGYGVEENERKALKYLKESAKKGYAESQVFLAEKYEKGEGDIKMDKKEALRWYERASKQGNAKGKAGVKRLEVKKK